MKNILSKYSVFIACICSILLFFILTIVFNFFNIETIIELADPITTTTRYYEIEKDSFATFASHWQFFISIISGMYINNYLNSNHREKTRALNYSCFAITATFLPAHFLEASLESINSDAIVNLLDSLIIISIFCSFYLFWRQYKNTISELAGYKLWKCTIIKQDITYIVIIEEKSREQAQAYISNDFVYQNHNSMEISPYNKNISITNHRKSIPNIIESKVEII